MKGKIKEIIQIIGGVCRITVEVGQIDENLKKLELEKVDCDIEIKKYREKRSLNSNSYCWVLIEKLAQKMKLSKDEVYLKMLRDYGTIATDSDGEKIIFSVKASVDVSKYFKYFKFLGDSKDWKFKHYFVIKGSSEYDRKEMILFLDGIIETCKDLEIETMTPSEIEKLNKMSYEG